uniref:DUF1618 domain-containing protein n=1 Tax=Oryza glumipatula TaxID=40148 RepID=A0A0E0B6I4_9ORYZ
MAKGRRLWKTKHLTLRPPCHGGGDGDGDGGHPDWILLDVQAYIADRRNATTATAMLSNGGHQIQVTICVAPPPLVSYICAWSPTTHPAELFDTEPTVEAVDADLLLLRIHVSLNHVHDLVYQASMSPSLTLMPSQDPYLHEPNCIALIPRSSHGFYISTLDMDLRSGIGRYNLCLFDSTNSKWSHESLSLDQLRNPPDKNEVLHITEKVITLKHPHLVAFVDLWRGIIICDILDSKIAASYVPIPKEIINLNRTRGSLITRDIAVVKDRLTMVRMGIFFDPEINGWHWELSTWSRPVGSCLDDEEDEDWREDFMVESCDISVDDNTCKNVELLPKTQDDRPAIAKLHVANPTLSLTDPQVVYLVGNVDITDEKAVLLTLDMANKRLQRVSVYDAERFVNGVDVGFTQSTISRYFAPASDLAEIDLFLVLSRFQVKLLIDRSRGSHPSMSKNYPLTRTIHLTLRPPCHGGDPWDADHPPEWVLLDVRAYVADRRNATTATARLGNGHAIQVTICAAPPPLVSYICAWSPTSDPAELFEMEPTVEAVNADLVLLRIHVLPYEFEDLVYRAKGWRTPLPSLTPIPKQDPYLQERYNIAILPRSHGFYISTLDCYFPDPERSLGRYNLCIFDSLDCKWSNVPLSLDQLRNPPDKNKVFHLTEKEDWREDSLVEASDILIDHNICNVELLPKIQGQPTMAKLHVALPTLSLTDAQVVYVMGKVNESDKKAVLLSIDMANRRLDAVSVYDAARILHYFDVCYTQSTIFRYSAPSSGLNGNLKRPGKFPMPYPRKQQAVNEPFLPDAGRGLETEDRDTMDWE